MTMPNNPDLSTFSDAQLMTLLNVPGAMRVYATQELARRHPLETRTDPDPAAAQAAMALQGAQLPTTTEQKTGVTSTTAGAPAEPAEPTEPAAS